MEVEDHDLLTVTKKFSGRWLVQDIESEHDADVQHPLKSSEITDHFREITRWSVAETAKGRIAVLATGLGAGESGFWHFDDLDEAAEKGIPSDVLSKAAGALGIERAELLDI